MRRFYQGEFQGRISQGLSYAARSRYRQSEGQFVNFKHQEFMCDMYLSEVDDIEISPESFARYMFEYAQRY